MLHQVPIEFPIARNDPLGQSPGIFFMGRCRLRLRCPSEGVDHTMPHFAGCFPRKGKGEDGFGLLHFAQQRQEALNQELRLPCARWRLHDERAGMIQGLETFGLVGDPLLRHLSHRHPPDLRHWSANAWLR